MADPLIITVAMAGTPEAASADYVCDGVDDDVEINAALAAAGVAGGGIVRLAAGDYSTGLPITVFDDNVSIEGDPNGGTAIRPDAGHWMSLIGADGALLTAAVNFVGVDNFAARFLTIEAVGSGGSPPLDFNGIQAIPTGALGAGEICTNGVFEGNNIRLAQGHTYSLWSLRTEGMEIIGNHIDGGSSLDNANPSQEGIEIYGGRDVLISGNTITGMGNAAIQLGGVAESTADASVDHITVTDNQVSNSRAGVFVGTTSDPVNGADNATNILIEHNQFTAMFETGFMVRAWTGSADAPPEIGNIVFRDNDVEMLYAPASGFSPAAVWLFNVEGTATTTTHDVAIEGNRFTTTEVAAVPATFWLGAGFIPLIALQNFVGVTISGNDIAMEHSGPASRGILAFGSSDVTVSGNNISGAGLYPIEFFDGHHILVEGNTLSDWGRGQNVPGIILGEADDYSVTGNVLHGADGGSEYFIATYDSADPTNVADNIRIADGDASLMDGLIHELQLAGAAVSGSGGASDDVITGNGLANLLDGGEGADQLTGGAGNDLYVVDNPLDRVIEREGEGDDLVFSSVDFQLPDQVESLTLSGDAIAGTGNALDNVITGNDFANLLDGGAGDDQLVGGKGDDVYVVDSALDRVVELDGEGTDTVLALTSYALGQAAGVERLYAQDPAAAIDLAGNGQANELHGNEGANLLDGGAGADVLVGFGGNDIYYVDHAGDQIVEAAGGGTDTVYSKVSYALADGQEVEYLAARITADTAAIDLTGNALSNQLFGNAGANLLDGGAGADVLVGFDGNDTYYVDNAGDQVYEAVGGGTDTIYSTVSYQLVESQEVEYLSTRTTADTAAINLTGNSLNNQLFGNAGANILDGAVGADVMNGFGGNDTYHVDNAGDQVYEAVGGGTDTIYATTSYSLVESQEVENLSTRLTWQTSAINLTGNALANTIFGNEGANIIDGKGGNDALVGFGGADIFAFTTTLGAGNVDVVYNYQAGIDKIGLSHAVFAGTGGPGSLNANAFFTGAAAHDANDHILYNSATGQLFYDADGNGAGVAVQFATLATGLSLTASDFQVI